MIEISGFDAIGLIGAAIAVGAYFATQQGWVRATDWRFPFANLIAAVMIMISLTVAWNLPAFVIEGFWFAISVYGLVRSLLLRR